MRSAQILRIVVASPGDVQAERDVVGEVAAELNRAVAKERGLQLEVVRWETDAYPGFHVDGPKGHLDRTLRIADCDLLIGIFWKRFGTPTADGDTGTEHEFRTAYKAWQQNRRPQIMVYFNRKPYMPNSATEAEQLRQVLTFQESFPKEGLRWTYKGVAQFGKLLRTHLTQFVLDLPKQDGLSSTPSPLEAKPAEPHLAQKGYLRYLIETTRDIPLLGLEKSASNAARTDAGPCLTDVYIALDTTAMEEREQRKGREERAEIEPLREEPNRTLTALEAFGQSPRLVLLGDPGSGKSTFVNYLVHCMARKQTEPDFDLENRLEALPEDWRGLLPVRVVMREMAAWMRETAPTVKKAALLHDYLQYWLKEIGQSSFTETLQALLQTGKALVLLDGWDEVQNDAEVLPKLRAMLNELPKCTSGCPLLMTCRVRSYEEEPWKLDATRWHAVSLREFDDDKIDAFVEAWYRHLTARGKLKAAAASASAKKLREAVRRPDLRRMAGNPLLLTMMSIDHTDKGELPDARSVVYEDIVELLLFKWREVGKSGEDGTASLETLLRLADRQQVHLRRALNRLAFEAHSSASSSPLPTRWGEGEGEGAHFSGERAADIPEYTLWQRFKDLHPLKDGPWADQLLSIVKLRSGLLIPSEPGSYTFPHRTFQEYLAACWLCSQDDVAREVLKAAHQGVYWREVVLLAVNRLFYLENKLTWPHSIVRGLCPPTEPEMRDTAGWREVWLAGECLREFKAFTETEDDVDLVERVRSRLVALLEHGLLEIPERIQAGSVLSALGDPRDLGEMIPIPAGEFVMGGDMYEWEQPQRRVTLDAYSIRKYAVTNGEYAAFVAATGHRAPDHWPDGAPSPELRNHPVVNVSWIDALAYCDWKGVSLPTEAQWEKAARGTDGREYPWGDEWEGARCANLVDENTLDGAVSVGCFTSGASPYGCMDMAGNVLEWCSDLCGDDYYKSAPDRNPTGPETGVYRVLRGGAWNGGGPSGFRAADRGGLGPDYTLDFSGFRCVSRADS